MTWTYYERLPRFNTLRIHLSRDLLLLDILIFVKFIKEIILCVALWNASAEGNLIPPEAGAKSISRVVANIQN